MLRVASFTLAGLLLASSATAQSQTLPAGVSSYAPATEMGPISWEARIGAAAANPTGRESGLLNFSGEVLTPRVMSFGDRVSSSFVPRFHIGASANFNGTRYAYAGATWTVDLSKTVFLEASLGAAVNDGKTGPVIPENRLALGCSSSSREAAALGVRLNDRWSLVATLEHFGAVGCSERDRPKGPANIGARLGYSF